MATTAIKVFFKKIPISFDYASQQFKFCSIPPKTERKMSQTLGKVNCTKIIRIYFLFYSFHFEFDSNSHTQQVLSRFCSSEAVTLFAFFHVIEISVNGYSVIHRSNFESSLNNFPFCKNDTGSKQHKTLFWYFLHSITGEINHVSTIPTISSIQVGNKKSFKFSFEKRFNYA